MTVWRFGAAMTMVFAAALTTACAGSPGAAPSTGGTPSAGVPSSPVATPDPTASAGEPADPTCKTIISSTTVQDFTELGWTAKEEPFFVGETQLPDGLQCTWGDYSVPSDLVQLFGWAPITDEEITTARSELRANGWREVNEDGQVYVTENADTAVSVDDEGYGLTYLFGDGWVKLADTKQGLLLVEWPQE